MVKNQILFLILCFNLSFSQSNKDLSKEREPYKTNKVKTESVTYSTGYKKITKFDSEGKKIEILGYHDNSPANITSFTYDVNGNLLEEAYYGYQSGDFVTATYFYDNSGNVIQIKTEGGDASNIKYEYDPEGNMITEQFYDAGTNVSTYPLFTKKYSYQSGRLEKVTHIDNLEGGAYYDELYIYENGKLFKKESTCNYGSESLEIYSYDEAGNIAEISNFEKVCGVSYSSNSFTGKSIFYYNNNSMLIKIVNRQKDSEETADYSYEYY